MQSDQVIEAVKYWLEKTIIGFNFCPFAKKEFVNHRVHYEVVDETNQQEMLLALVHEIERLDRSAEIETTLLILPVGLESFLDYLDFITLAEDLLVELDYEGIYQLASFHPDYCFEGVQQTDVSNYTNRSPYPIIHLLREASLEKVLAKYPNPELIPETNIQQAEEKGGEVFQAILNASFEAGQLLGDKQN